MKKNLGLLILIIITISFILASCKTYSCRALDGGVYIADIEMKWTNQKLTVNQIERICIIIREGYDESGSVKK